MAMTITEKILARASGRDRVHVGEVVEAHLDLVMATDVTMPLSFNVLESMGATEVFNPGKIVAIRDHFTPAPSVSSAGQGKYMREKCKEYSIKNYYDLGVGGVCHVIVPDMGLVAPGEVVVGADSHTTTYGAVGAFSTGLGSTDVAVAMAIGKLWFKIPPTLKVVLSGKLPKWVTGKDLILAILGQIGTDGARYKALEIGGEVVKHLEMSDRFTMCNMGIEGGAKNAIFEPDDKTIAYLDKVCSRPYTIFRSDEDAVYERVLEIDCTNMDLQVALPHSPGNVSPLSKVKGTRIDQVYIGSCTNGRLNDLRQAAQLLKGKKAHDDVRLIITPGSQEVYLQALREGLIEDFVQAGAVVNPPSCGACFGGHLGVLAEGETCLSTTNRNFKGRMGSSESFVYLSSPIVAAASAIKGEITYPEEVL
ncbi:MAG: 3-isopropylmalate dehydratase large subunit [Bacillota bacterium]|nr:3-isopropylmalate dehydratase large subunit [Bacillota bacterium]